MNDFQKFLDTTFAKINVKALQEEETTIYEYDIYEEIRKLIVDMREREGLTQKQLAKKSGLTQSNISNIEKGVTRPTVESLKKIADAFGKRLIVEFADREDGME